MKFETIDLKDIGFTYYKSVHSSGLTIYLYPDKSYHSTYAIFGTNYGSIDNSFSVNGESFKDVPAGIAHFLEHKLFESEDKDAFERYAKTGASANAFTSFDKTCYLFSTSDNSKESLEILLDFVSNPYFTDDTVKKEQGIIGQEIKMYDDSPNWQVFFGLLGLLYHNNPVKVDIAGTVESISTISKDLLYECYQTFYRPDNMVLAVAGNFEIEDISELAECYIKKPDNSITVIKRNFDEPRTVNKKLREIKLPVSMPLFAIGYKEIPDEDADFVRGQVINEIIMEAIAGEASDLFCALYDTGLVNLSFSTEVFAGRGYFANIFEGESKEPLKVADLINKYLKDAKKNGIKDEIFQRAVKVVYGRYIRVFNNLESIAGSMLSMHFYNSSIYESVSILKDIKSSEINERLLKHFNEEYRSISIVKEI